MPTCPTVVSVVSALSGTAILLYTYKMQGTVSALLVGLFVALASADEFTSPNVVHLTSKNYEDAVNDGKVYFVKFYAPWCGHCKRLADTWKKLATTYKDSSQIAIGHVDCTQDRDVCTSFDVKGYPTLKVIYKGEEIKAYRGQRELSALKSFIEEAAKEMLTEV